MPITVHHIPVCPFCQRLEILLERLGKRDEVEFSVVDITEPRDPAILELTGGSTALPVMDLHDGRSLKESLVLMEYLHDRFSTAERSVHQRDAYRRAVENLMVSMASPFVVAGYRFVMNQDRERRGEFEAKYVEQLAGLSAFLERHATADGPWLFEDFGWAETAFTPFFQRFAFIEYYEGVDIPAGAQFDRVRAWRDACVAHPDAQQAEREEIIKLYYDYALGVGDGGDPPGERTRSSFVFTPHWRDRPWPPRDKYGEPASDAKLGLARIGRSSQPSQPGR